MDKTSDLLSRLAEEIEQALNHDEMSGQLDQALAIYRDVEVHLRELKLSPDQPDYPAQQEVLAYCLMRQANILRQKGQNQEANQVSLQEICAARLSGNQLTLARSLMSFGATNIVNGDIDGGLQLMEEARSLFEQDDSYDYRQGLGWYWIMKADLSNSGLITEAPLQAVRAADQALAILQPINNWQGIARAFMARAKANERMGNTMAAEEDRRAGSQVQRLNNADDHGVE